MKNTLAIALLLASATMAHAATDTAKAAPMDYKQLVSKAVQMDQPVASKTVLDKEILKKHVRLDLKGFSGGAAGYYVDTKERISFTCEKKADGFKGGLVDATIVSHNMGDGTGHVFVLDNCANSAAKK